MRIFPCAVLRLEKFPHMDKNETLFFVKRWALLWSEIYLDNYLLMRAKNVKTSLKI